MSSHCPFIALIPIVASAVMLYIQSYRVDINVVDLESAVGTGSTVRTAKAGHRHSLRDRQ
ncbi:hypothetical protein BDW67DRAFT_163927 [Aspergillus spinulosporus]